MDIDINTLLEMKNKIEKDLAHSGEFFYEDRPPNDEIRIKGKNDFVTEVDVKVQEYLKAKLLNILPHAQFIAEEKNNDDIDINKLTWILDPCDGTTNLVHGYKHSSISLGLAKDGKILLGMIYDPHTKELFWAIKEYGAFLGEKPIRVSNINNLKDALCAIGAGGFRINRTEETFDMIKGLFLNSQGIRRIGSAALEMCYVASGRTDAFLEEDLNIWDFAAGLLILKEAGALVKDFHGNDLILKRKSGVICANPSLLRELEIYYY